jgi:hypothetical protein
VRSFPKCAGVVHQAVTQEGDWVLDPFLGSGHQRACERVGETPNSSDRPLINLHARARAARCCLGTPQALKMSCSYATEEISVIRTAGYPLLYRTRF